MLLGRNEPDAPSQSGFPEARMHVNGPNKSSGGRGVLPLRLLLGPFANILAF